MHGWAWALMIIGNVIFWGLLIIAAIALIRYTKRGQVDSASHTTQHRSKFWPNDSLAATSTRTSTQGVSKSSAAVRRAP